MAVEVLPNYGSISLIADLCEPWIELWGGGEWGESMQDLRGACHTDYGFSDEDCALFASKLIANLDTQRKWVEGEGYEYGIAPAAEAHDVQAKCREIRDYWLKGGNLGSSATSTVEAVKKTLESFPAEVAEWMFGDDNPEPISEPILTVTLTERERSLAVEALSIFIDSREDPGGKVHDLITKLCS